MCLPSSLIQRSLYWDEWIAAGVTQCCVACQGLLKDVHWPWRGKTYSTPSPLRRRASLILRSIWGFIVEHKARENPKRYGFRLPYRRVFFIIGLSAFSYVTWHEFHTIETSNAKEEVKSFLESLHENVTWPSDQDGGTIFDQAFHE